ncbi:MAG: cell division protein SepF [Acidimicrobiales bacterium]
MSNFMKSARSWLGLGNDPYYEDEYGDPDYDEEDEDDHYAPRAEEPRPAPRPVRSSSSRSSSVVRPPGSDWEENDGGVRVISASAATPGSEPESRGVVRPLPSAAKPHVVSPSTFNDVQQVADSFKRSQPVIVNLQGVDRDLSRRLIDFASGLCYGLEGNMERVADNVFLLTPSGAQISDDDRRRLREQGLSGS